MAMIYERLTQVCEKMSRFQSCFFIKYHEILANVSKMTLYLQFKSNQPILLTYIRTKASLGLPSGAFVCSQKGITVIFIEKSDRLDGQRTVHPTHQRYFHCDVLENSLYLSLHETRSAQSRRYFSQWQQLTNSLGLVENKVTISQVALPKSDAFVVMTQRARFIYRYV